MIPPAETPVDLDEVKAHLRNIDFCDDDAALTMFIQAATQKLDGWGGLLQRCLVAQTWEEGYPAFCSCDHYVPGGPWFVWGYASPYGGCIRPALAPVMEVTELAYFDTGNIKVIVDPANYVLSEDRLGPRIDPVPGYTWPSVQVYNNNAVSLTYVSGYSENPQALPADLRLAICQMVGHWYEHRESTNTDLPLQDLPQAATEILQRYRRFQ